VERNDPDEKQVAWSECGTVRQDWCHARRPGIPWRV